MKEFWNTIQFIFAAIGGWLGYFLGGCDGLLIALVAFVVIDYITGVMCAAADKKLSSAVGFKGICRKVLIFLLVGIANMGMPGNSTLVDICDTYCRELQNAGYYVGIYASLSWFNNKLNDSRLDKYDKWVAQWNPTCDYKKPYGIWQYTDKFMVGGYPFDANWAYKDYPAITGAKKEETKLTEAQVKKLVQDEYGRLNPTYNTLADVPSYWRANVEKLMDLGVIAGVGNGKLGLTRSEAKSAVVALRLVERFFEQDGNWHQAGTATAPSRTKAD